MNKKGFTLVEIIICISLIVLIGTTSIITLNKLNDKKSLIEEINLKVKDAVNVYLNVEKDNKGNTYLNGIQKGGKGLYFTINELYENGYISEDIVKTLEEETNKDRTQLKLLASDSLYKDDSNECGANYIKIDFNWNTSNSTEPIYLCPILDKVETNDNTLYNKIVSLGYTSDCKLETNNVLCYLHSYDNSKISDSNDEGISEDIYYFKGNTNNNYLKIQGIDELFRIVRTTENKNIKIVYDKTIVTPVSFNRAGGRIMYTTTKNKPYFNIAVNSYGEYWLSEYIEKDNNYECDSTKIFSKWNENQKIRCTTSSGKVISFDNPIYTNIYKPIDKYWKKISSKMSKFIDKNYKWCIGGNVTDMPSLNSIVTSNDSNVISFRCDKEKTLIEDFGLLNIFEYANLGFWTTYADNPLIEMYGELIYSKYWKTYSEGNQHNQLAFSSNMGTYQTLETIKGAKGDSYFGDDEHAPLYLKPAHVIKGDSKVIQGNGTKTNPFIIE